MDFGFFVVNNFFGNKRMRLKRKAIALREEKQGAPPASESGEFC